MRVHSIPIQVSHRGNVRTQVHSIPVQVSRRGNAITQVHSIPVQVSRRGNGNTQVLSIPIQVSHRGNSSTRVHSIPIQVSYHVDMRMLILEWFTDIPRGASNDVLLGYVVSIHTVYALAGCYHVVRNLSRF